MRNSASWPCTIPSPLPSPRIYHYFLADSVPGAYLVHFRTKNPFYATFNGEMWIDSATYAVRSVYAEVPAQSRVNYLSQLQIHQQFAPEPISIRSMPKLSRRMSAMRSPSAVS